MSTELIMGLHRFTRGECYVVPANGLKVGERADVSKGRRYATLTKARSHRLPGEAIVSGDVVISIKR